MVQRDCQVRKLRLVIIRHSKVCTVTARDSFHCQLSKAPDACRPSPA